MRKAKTDIFLVNEPEHYLNDFKEMINNVLNHPYTNPENIDNYEMYKSFNDAYHKMSGEFYTLSDIFDGVCFYYSINPEKYKDKLPDEFITEYKWFDWLCTSSTAAIYYMANHDINECLRNIFLYNDHTKHHLNFTKFWNDTLKPVCEMFMDWVNDTEHTYIFRQNTYESLKPNTTVNKYKRTEVWNFPGTKYWKHVIFVNTEEERTKYLENQIKLLNECKEALKTTQVSWFYTDKISQLENKINALEGKITPEYSNIFVLNIK